MITSRQDLIYFKFMEKNMSFYFDYVIERKNNENEWKCVSKSSFDYEMNVLNVGVLKESFIDTEFYDSLKPIENELSKDSFAMFSRKIDRFKNNDEEDYPYSHNRVIDEMNPFSMDCLKSMAESKLKNNDLILWFDMKNLIFFGKDVLKNHIRLSDDKRDTYDMELIKKMMNDIDGINDEKSLLKKSVHWNNCICYESKHLLGINFECTPYVLNEILTYSTTFKNLRKRCPLDKIIMGISNVRYTRNKKEIKQWNYNAKVSYPSHLKKIINELNCEIRQYDTSTYIDNEVKKKISMMLDKFKGDKAENNTALYQHLKKWCENYKSMNDMEYIDELKIQKSELEFALKIMGDDGRMIWSIE